MGFFGDREEVAWFWFGGLALGSFGGSQGEEQRRASQVHCRYPLEVNWGRKFIIYRAGRADRVRWPFPSRDYWFYNQAPAKAPSVRVCV
jgi:hypothetical protein